MKQLLFSLLLLVSTTLRAADDTAIARAVQNLSSANFRHREDATRQLIAAGSKAIEPVTEIARCDDLEVSFRAIGILQSLVESDQQAVREQAAKALEKLAAERTTVVAELASDALAVYESTRQDRAIAQLLELGAVIPSDLIELEEDEGVHLKFARSWHGSSANLQLLTQIPDLTMVMIYNVSLDDAAVATLKQLSNVRKIKLYGTGLSAEAAQNLAAAFPGGVIDCRKGALLGIIGQQTNVGCRVDRTQSGSAAEAADIRSGDEIVSFDGQTVATFTEFTNLVSKKNSGDLIKIVLRRGNPDAALPGPTGAAGQTGSQGAGQPAEVLLTKEVTLGGWQ